MGATVAYEPPLHGDILEAVLSRLPLVDLVQASVVSNAWRDSIDSTLAHSLTRARPWLFLHVQSRTRLSQIETHVYDPYSRAWMRFPNAASCPAEPLRVAEPGLLYTLTPTSLRFSSDPFKTKWVWTGVQSGLQVWRRDPAVALFDPDGPRPRLVAIGGACEFEDDADALEVYDIADRRWERRESLPERLKGVSDATWQAVAKDRHVYVLESGSGVVCRFDVDDGKWGPPVDVSPEPAVFHSSLVVSGDRMVLIGVSADALRLWEVDFPTGKCESIGQMPTELFGELYGGEFREISCLGEGDFLYVYNGDQPQNIFSVDISDGRCDWEVIRNSPIGDKERIGRILLTCSRVSLGDVRSIFRPKGRGSRS